ncbi:ATP-binding protein, partial [Streptomyces shenzhenensis]
PEQAARWSELTAAYVRSQALGGPAEEPMARAVAALGLLADRLAAVESALTRAVAPVTPPADPRARHAARPKEQP